MINMISSWNKRLTIAQTGHYISSERYILINRLIGIPLVILSTFVSAFLFFDGTEYSYYSPTFMKLASILVALLASLQTLTRPTEKAEAHRACASKYGNLKRKIEQFSAAGSTEEDWKKFSKEITIEWAGIAENAPTTPQKIRDKANYLINNKS